MYITIDHQKIDISKFVSLHPGGQLILEQVQDLNVTHLFSSYHALSDPVIMKKYASMVSYNDTIIEKRVYKRIKNYFSSKM